MMHAVLRFAAGRGSTSVAELAEELGSGELVVHAMLVHLGRLGYLRVVGDDCAPTSCGGCNYANSCLSHSAPRTWSLTAKGESLLREVDQPA